MRLSSTTRAAALAGLALTTSLGALLVPGVAHAADQADKVVVEGELAADGSLKITETLTFSSGAPASVQQQLTARQDVDRSGYRSFSITEVTASADGRQVSAGSHEKGERTTITVEAPGAKQLVIGYSVRGATRPAAANGKTAAGVLVEWPMLQGLSVGAKEVSGRVRPMAPVTFVDCESGPVGGHQPCATFQGGQMPDADPQFTDGVRGAGEQVVLSFGQPRNAVAVTETIGHRWSLDRAFSVNPTTALTALLPLLLGALALFGLHRRIGRDVVDPQRITPVAEFHPVAAGQSEFRVLADVRPGHVGTVADERVDPVDVTATLLDLAVRGWLRIVELPREGAHKPLDWTFERREGTGELRTFERLLRDAVAPEGAEPVRVSSITTAVAGVVPQVQSSLYDDVVARGWFDHRPDQTRSRWTVLGWTALVVALVVAAALVALTTHGLLALALLALAIGLLLVAQEMPRRTAAGSSLLGGLSALSSQLLTQPTDQLPAGREAEQLAQVLPYAVVLGGADRWLDALVRTDDDDDPDGEDLDWYRAPGTWHLRDLPDSVHAFITTVQGRLFSR